MDTTLLPEIAEDAQDEDTRVRDWRVDQLWHLGVPRLLARAFADDVDWHEVARLVERGCPPLVALQIAW
jgi:hypothetical protein